MAAVAPTPIDDLPPPPDPNDRSTFNSRAYPWSLAQQTMATQANALASNVYGNALDAAQSATAADTARGLANDARDTAQGAAAEAQGHATDAANAAYSVASPWAPGAYTANQVVWLNASSGSLYRCIADVNSAVQPNLDDAHWVYVGPAPEPLPASATYTYTDGLITKITEDGVDTTIAYNADGTVKTVSYPHAGKTRTETYSYTNGVPTGMTAVEA